MTLNVSEVMGFNFTVPSTGMEVIDIKDIIRDVATQIDTKVVLCLIFVFIYWYMKVVILPYSLIGFKSVSKDVYDLMKVMIDGFISITETFMVGGILVIIGFYIIQNGFHTYFKVTAWILGTLTALVFFVKWRDKKRQSMESSGE